MLQFLLDFGIDCTLRIIPASVDPTYCLLIMANILNTLPACIADKISYTIHASAKTTSTFSFLAEEEFPLQTGMCILQKNRLQNAKDRTEKQLYRISDLLYPKSSEMQLI